MVIAEEMEQAVDKQIAQLPLQAMAVCVRLLRCPWQRDSDVTKILDATRGGDKRLFPLPLGKREHIRGLIYAPKVAVKLAQPGIRGEEESDFYRMCDVFLLPHLLCQASEQAFYGRCRRDTFPLDGDYPGLLHLSTRHPTL